MKCDKPGCEREMEGRKSLQYPGYPPFFVCPATPDQHRIAALESELAATRKELEDTRRELEVARIMAMTDEEIRQDCEARGTTVEAEAAKVREVFDKAIQAFRQRGKTGEGTE